MVRMSELIPGGEIYEFFSLIMLMNLLSDINSKKDVGIIIKNR